MRRGILIFAITCLSLLIYLTHGVWTLLTLLVINGESDAILPIELGDEQDQTQIIPRIIHQTYKNDSIPEAWQGAQQSCIMTHPDWEYKFWSDELSEQFIAERYPWFLETFTGYRYNIQRADAIRYFALDYYGGIYIDLDDGCGRSLEPLRQYPAWVRKTTPTGISNDVMGAVPGHPFFKRVIRKLQHYDRPWLSLPYATVMGSTGPLFLSLMWRHWTDEGLNDGDGRVRILFADEYMGGPSSFFTRHKGNSWHQYDVDVWFWLLKNWIPVTVICTLGGLGLILCAWLLYSRLVLTRLKHQDSTSSGPMAQCLPVWARPKRGAYLPVSRYAV